MVVSGWLFQAGRQCARGNQPLGARQPVSAARAEMTLCHRALGPPGGPDGCPFSPCGDNGWFEWVLPGDQLCLLKETGLGGWSIAVCIGGPPLSAMGSGADRFPALCLSFLLLKTRPMIETEFNSLLNNSSVYISGA